MTRLRRAEGEGAVVGSSAGRRSLAGYFVHLHALTAKQPLEGHVVYGLLAGNGAAEHSVPNEAWEERIRMQGLAEQRCRDARQSESDHYDFAHCHLSTPTTESM